MAAIWLLRVDLLFVALFLIFISWGDILLRIISHRYLLVLTVLIFFCTHFTASKTQSGCSRERFARGLLSFFRRDNWRR